MNLIIQSHAFEGVNVFDTTIGCFAIERAAIPNPMLVFRGVAGTGQLVFRHEADEPQRLGNFRHDLIAGIDAQPTVNALILEPVADINTRWADLYTDAAVNAITGACGLPFVISGLAAADIVGHRLSVGIDHDALK